MSDPCATNGSAFHEGMAKRVINFSAGPCCLPVEVLYEAQQDLLNCNDSGMSVMEMSHRSKEFLHIFTNAKNTLKELIGMPDDYNMLFMQGGASLQFAAVPMNLMSTLSGVVDVAVTGSWSERAFAEAGKYAKATRGWCTNADVRILMRTVDAHRCIHICSTAPTQFLQTMQVLSTCGYVDGSVQYEGIQLHLHSSSQRMDD
eukprot:GHVS01075181.1.p1 GENE.GHVS01075181.1~~GHVS01075181.1.p1  ORF type:complete len:219 (+),score=24.92 GHVS01075181.1:53-658(+)